MLTQYFVSCVHGRFYFSLPLIFTLLVASISHFLTAALNFHVFLPTKFVSLVSITRSSFFSFIDVSVNIRDNTEKDTSLMLLFLSKSPGGHVISFQIKPWVAYLLFELFYIGMPAVRTDSRSLCVRSREYHIFLGMGLCPCASLLWSSATNRKMGHPSHHLCQF